MLKLDQQYGIQLLSSNSLDKYWIKFSENSILLNILLELNKFIDYKKEELVTVDEIFDIVYDTLVGSIQKEFLIEKGMRNINFSGGFAYFMKIQGNVININILQAKEMMKKPFIGYWKEMTDKYTPEIKTTTTSENKIEKPETTNDDGDTSDGDVE